MRIRSIPSIPVLLLASGALLLAARAATALDAMNGEVVNLGCKLAAMSTCPAGGLKQGLPMALRTDDGQLYLLLENHDNPKPYGQLRDMEGQKVSVEGDKVTQGGTQGLIVETLKP